MFLTTKLFLPTQPPGVIIRERLYKALDESWSSQSRLLLLSAPPGYGKTTLLSGWTQSRGVATAWVSLDVEDNDPGQFFQLLLRALEPHIPELVDLVPILGLPQTTNLGSLLVEMINCIAQTKVSVLLAVDDYHTITAPAIHNLLQQMLDHLPPQLRLAVLTREDPPFTLARLRARRQMLELRARELTFSNEEGQALLVGEQNLPLNTSQVESVVERTEGWAAGLQLAALALRDHAQPEQMIDSFGGAHHYVLDYLVGEVLENLPEDLRAFLFRSAVLDRFTASLCDAALEIDHSQALIARAKSANLFLVPLDDQGSWYRYHHLMADILRAEVEPGEQREIYLRAARWFQAHQQPVEAIHYALEAQDYDLASEMIGMEAISTVEKGLLTTALGWVERLPQEIVFAKPDLCVYRAWFLLFNGRFQEAMAWLGQITHQLPHMPGPLAGLLTGMLAWMPSVSGQKLDLARLQAAYAQTEGRYPYFSPLLLLAIGQAQREAGDFGGALLSFEEGARLAETSSGAVSALIIRNNQIFLLNETGARQEALELCLDCIEQYSGPDGKPGLLAGIPLLAYGFLLAESGAAEEAQAALTQGINLVRRLGLYDILTAPANYALQFVLADQGRFDEALALNKEVRRRALKAGLTGVARETETAAAWLNFTAGNLAPAMRWAEANPLEDAPAARLSLFSLLHARLLARSGDPQGAADLLLPQIEHTRAWGLVNYWVRGCVELALIYLEAWQEAQALDALAPAVERAEAIEYRQPFRRNATALSPVLEKLRARHPLFVESVCCAAPQPSRGNAPGMVEELTARESEILRLVAAGMSNADISSSLYLTTGTVKWYLNQIYGKLGVGRRTEAVARAQAAGLI